MKLKHYIWSVLFILGLMQTAYGGNEVKVNGNCLTLTQGKDIYLIEVCNESILKVDFRPNGELSPNTPVIDKKKWEGTKANINTKSNPIRIQTSRMKVEILQNPIRITVYDAQGKLLVSEKAVSGSAVSFTHNTNDNFYGLSGYNRDFSKNLHLLRNEGGKIEAEPQGGCGAPFIWSTAGYGFAVDTDGGQVENKNGVLSFNNCSRKNMEYYILVGNPRDIIAAAGEIAGKPQMFPKWNTGFGQLEWGIDEPEFKSHIEGYRKRDIPFDWFMLDFDWMAWGEDNYGEFRWGSKFPSGATGELKKWMDNKGVKMTAITKPRIVAKNNDGTFTAQGKYAEENGFWYPGENFFNDYASGMPSKDLQYAIPECQEWWWKHLKEGGFDKGMIGFLNDECDDSNQGGLYSLGNLSNIFMQKSIYEGQRAITNQRVWSVNRTAYMGSQKYAYSIWSGDNYPTFTDLRSQPVKMLVANNTLVPVWGFCITAFWNTAPVTEELYIRSMQLGLFSPLFFVHGMHNVNKQPWLFGEKVENTSKEIIELRYRLIPYIYAYDRVKHETMLGISRALMIDYPNDPEVADSYESFMFGDYILASPVVDSMISTKRIYLPEGNWIDFNKGNVYKGKQYINYALDNRNWKDIPMFVKEGAIIPTQDVMQYVGEKEVKTIYLDLFPAATESTFPMYEDDGNTYDYEKGAYFKQLISLKGGKEITVGFAAQEGKYKPTFTCYISRIHGKQAREVKAGNIPLKKFVSYEELQSSNETGWCTGKDIYGDVTYVKTPINSKANFIMVK